MTYSDDFNIRTTSVTFNNVADAIDGTITRNVAGTTTGVANTYIATPTPAWSAYQTSAFLSIVPHVTNTGASTINVSGLGAKSIKRSGADVGAGALTSGVPTFLIYNGTHFEILVIENAIKQDGSNSPTANLPMAGFKHTGVGDASASDQYMAFGQISNGTTTVNVGSLSSTSLSIGNTGTFLATLIKYSADANPLVFTIAKSRGATIGANVIVQNGDQLGRIAFAGANGTSTNDGARITAVVDGAPGATNDMPTALLFSVTADGAGSPTERMRISPNGNIGLDNTVPTVPLDYGISKANIGQIFNIYTTGNTRTGIGMDSATAAMRLYSASGNAAAIIGHVSTADGSTFIERARVHSNGYLGVNNNNPGTLIDAAESTNGASQARIVNANTGSSASAMFTLGNNTSSSGAQIILNSSANTSLSGANSLMLYNGIAGGAVGIYAAAVERLRVGAGGTVTMSAYGAGTATFSAAGVISSVSDETLKIKDGPILNAIGKLRNLEPGYWFWKPEAAQELGPQRELGFFAQNVHEAIGEEAAPTPKDGKSWGLYDRSVLAVVVQALKDYEAYIGALEARIASLEGAA